MPVLPCRAGAGWRAPAWARWGPVEALANGLQHSEGTSHCGRPGVIAAGMQPWCPRASPAPRAHGKFSPAGARQWRDGGMAVPRCHGLKPAPASWPHGSSAPSGATHWLAAQGTCRGCVNTLLTGSFEPELARAAGSFQSRLVSKVFKMTSINVSAETSCRVAGQQRLDTETRVCS